MKKIIFVALASLVFLAFGHTPTNADNFQPNPQMKRSDVPEVYKWDKEHVFKDGAQWENAHKEIEKLLPESVSKCKGRMGNSIAEFKDCFLSYYALLEKFYKVRIYANYLVYSGDRSNSDAGNMRKRSISLDTKFSEQFAFLKPELKEIGSQRIIEYINGDPELSKYAYYFNDIFRMQENILSGDLERIISLTGKIQSGPTTMSDAFELDTPYSSYSDTLKVLNNGVESDSLVTRTADFNDWYTARSDKRRWRREKGAELYFKSLLQLKNTWAQNLSEQIEMDIFNAKSANYGSSLEMALKNANVPMEVYNNLIEVVKSNTEKTLHRYVSFKKEVMDLPEYRIYDNYVTMIPKYDAKIKYEEARRHINNAFKPFGKEYQNDFMYATDPNNGWIDIYPNKNKDYGAFSVGVYGVHPFVLLNHMDNYRNFFTIAHELGHALHSYNSGKNQPLVYYYNPTIISEIASVTGEVLTYSYMIKRAQKNNNRDELLFLYDSLLDYIRQTLIRQTQFAEFEKIIHEMAEADEPLNAEIINGEYEKTVRDYYGPDFSFTPSGQFWDQDSENPEKPIYLDGIEWAFVSQFYRTFYVYSYATSFAYALATVKKIESGKLKPEKYLEFLRSGSSKSPAETIKILGHDIMSKEPFQLGMDYYAELLGKFEKLYADGIKK